MMKIKVSTEELVKAKFSKTIATVEGFYKEAKGDVAIDQGYQATAVYRRMDEIREALNSDLQKLARDLSVGM
jgi:hypothetical protein